jgi:hypothetical protein
MSVWRRWARFGAGLVAAFVWQAASAEQPAAPKAGLPLMGLDGDSRLGTLTSSPIADPKGDEAAANKVKIEEPPHAPIDPKAMR